MKLLSKILICSLVLVGVLTLTIMLSKSEGPKKLSRIPYGDNGHCTLFDNGMVTIEKNGSKDSLPINLVSLELIEAFAKDLESKK